MNFGETKPAAKKKCSFPLGMRLAAHYSCRPLAIGTQRKSRGATELDSALPFDSTGKETQNENELHAVNALLENTRKQGGVEATFTKTAKEKEQKVPMLRAVRAQANRIYQVSRGKLQSREHHRYDTSFVGQPSSSSALLPPPASIVLEKLPEPLRPEPQNIVAWMRKRRIRPIEALAERFFVEGPSLLPNSDLKHILDMFSSQATGCVDAIYQGLADAHVATGGTNAGQQPLHFKEWILAIETACAVPDSPDGTTSAEETGDAVGGEGNKTEDGDGNAVPHVEPTDGAESAIEPAGEAENKEGTVDADAKVGDGEDHEAQEGAEGAKEQEEQEGQEAEEGAEAAEAADAAEAGCDDEMMEVIEPMATVDLTKVLEVPINLGGSVTLRTLDPRWIACLALLFSTRSSISLDDLRLEILPQMSGILGLISELDVLSVQRNPILTSTTLPHIVHSCRNLRILNVSGCAFLDSFGVLDELTSLEVLIALDCPILGSAKGRMLKHKQLRELHLQGCQHLLYMWADCPNMVQLDLSTLPCRRVKGRFKQLRILDLARSTITELIERDFTECVALEYLCLRSCAELTRLEIGSSSTLKELVIARCPKLASASGRTPQLVYVDAHLCACSSNLEDLLAASAIVSPSGFPEFSLLTFPHIPVRVDSSSSESSEEDAGPPARGNKPPGCVKHVSVHIVQDAVRIRYVCDDSAVVDAAQCGVGFTSLTVSNDLTQVALTLCEEPEATEPEATNGEQTEGEETAGEKAEAQEAEAKEAGEELEEREECAYLPVVREGVRQKLIRAAEMMGRQLRDPPSHGVQHDRKQEAIQELNDAMFLAEKTRLRDFPLYYEIAHRVLSKVLPDKKFPCPLSCEESVDSTTFEAHILHDCPLRKMQCDCMPLVIPKDGPEGTEIRCLEYVVAREIEHHKEIHEELKCVLPTWNAPKLREIFDKCVHDGHKFFSNKECQCRGCQFDEEIVRLVERRCNWLDEKVGLCSPILDHGFLALDFDAKSVAIEDGVKFESAEAPDTAAKFEESDEERTTAILQDLAVILNAFMEEMVIDVGTDVAEPVEFAQELATNRAVVIINSLADLGVSRTLMQAKGNPGGGKRIALYSVKPEVEQEAEEQAPI